MQNLRDTVRHTIAEQIAPIVRLDAELSDAWNLELDREQARARVATGLVAYEPMEVIASAGSLLSHYVRATTALERAGLANPDEAVQMRERRYRLTTLIAAWVVGEPPPADRVRGLARRAAAIVAGSILRRASRDIRDALPLEQWDRPHCPCCGGQPEFASIENGIRTLICARCDTAWQTDRLGCVGCGALTPPTLAKVVTSIGYALTMCNSCGRYLKEPLEPHDMDPFVERALTAHLDAAAERRGLML